MLDNKLERVVEKSSTLCSKCRVNETRSGLPWCPACYALSEKKRRTRLKAEGLCVECEAVPPRKDGLTVCSSCYAKRASAQAARRLKNKHKAVELLGGSCVDCGLRTERIEVYDFHHIDPATKEFSLGNKFHFSSITPETEEEIKKCVLLCANCHRMRHAEYTD